jgi:peptidoglycan hydrolase-like protein with peptidoglycan-binding domain
MYDSLWTSTPRSNRQTGVAALIVATLTVSVWACAASPAQAADGLGLDAEIPAVEAPATPTHLLARGAGYGKQGGSEPVRGLQRLLRRHGYEPGPIDGLYGPLTEAAVKRFQQAHGLAVDGAVGPQTSRAVRAEQSRARGAPPVRPGAGYESPDGSQRVREIQHMLRALGYDCGPVDGLFGPRTQAAVQWLQAKSGLRPTGVVDAATLRRLRAPGRSEPPIGASPSSHELEAPPPVSAGWHGRPTRAPRVDSERALAYPPRHRAGLAVRAGAGYRSPAGSPRVREIQRMLRQLGYRSGPVDGRFGPRTRASVQWFQVKRGLSPRGTVDGTTFAHLRALTSPRGSADAARKGANAAAPAPRSARPPRGPAQPAPTAREDAHEQGGGVNLLLLVAVVGALGVAALSLVMQSKRRPGATERVAPADPTPPPAPASTNLHAGAADGTSAAPAPPSAAQQPAPRVVGYASAQDQAELERQAAAIERACRERGWTLACVIRENGSASGDRRKRPGLAHAVKQVREGLAGRLVVDSLTHLGRSEDEIREQLERVAGNEIDLVALDAGGNGTPKRRRQRPARARQSTRARGRPP